MHTDGDGLVTPDNPRAYADVVEHAGQQNLLRHLYIHRAGHCTFTVAEIVTALDVLIERIETGEWPAHDPATLNESARLLGPDDNVLATGRALDPGFFDFEPPPFPRRYDVRDHVPA